MAQSRFYTLALSLVGVLFSLAAAAEIAPFPTAVSDRPFTLPKGMTEVTGGMRLAFPRDQVGELAADRMFSVANVGIDVGVTDDLQFGVSWSGSSFPTFDPARSVSLNAGYYLFAAKYAASMARLELPVYFESSVVRKVVFAVPTSFGVTAHSSIMAFHESLIDIGFGNGQYSATLNLPIRYGYQINQNLWMGLGTSLAQLRFNTGEDHNFFWQKAPLGLSGLYALNSAFDVTAHVGFNDVYLPKETFSVGVGLAYRVGNLGG